MDTLMLILSAAKGAGKTTYLTQQLHALAVASRSVGGVAAPAVFDADRRIGYDLLDLRTGTRRPLARIADPSGPLPDAGPYSFDRTALADGNAAIERATAFDPDLVILDAMLPKRSGFLVLEKLKGPEKKRGSRPLVIMITGNEGKRHQVWAQSLGVDGYLTKPFRMERLVGDMEALFT